MACQFDSRKRELTRNLLALYRRATDDDKASGLAWYPAARRIVGEWSTTYGWHDATVACVIAALSPQLEWSRNLIIADDILACRLPSIGGALHSNIRKAQQIRDNVAFSTLPYFPHGPKVYNFACNLSGDDDAVTVDTHAMQAALADVQANYRLPWQPYGVLADCYRQAARKLSLTPCDFQAVIWHTWKRLHPQASKIQDRRQWHVVGELED